MRHSKYDMTLVRNVEKVLNIQCGFTATTKDGREITSNNRSSGSGSKERLQERTTFDVPLSEIKEFHFRTRPMRETIFRNVIIKESAGPNITQPMQSTEPIPEAPRP